MVGSLLVFSGYQCILAIVNHFTQWLKVAPIPATAIATALITIWILRFSFPSVITTDQGTQFESLFSSLTNAVSTKQIQATAYLPASSSLVERLHYQLKDTLQSSPHVPWTEHLLLALLGTPLAHKPDIGSSLAKLVLGTVVCLPGDFIDPPQNPPFCYQLTTPPAFIRPWLPCAPQPLELLTRPRHINTPTWRRVPIFSSNKM